MDTYNPIVIPLAKHASLFWFGAIRNTVSVNVCGRLYMEPESWLCSLFPAPTHPNSSKPPVTPAPGNSAPSSGLYKRSHTKHTQQ